MTDENYNGWSNRETWATALHIDNDQGFYNYRCELVELARTYGRKNAHRCLTEENATHIFLQKSLRTWIECLFESYFEEPKNNKKIGLMVQDIGSLWRVEWREIATSFLEE